MDGRHSFSVFCELGRVCGGIFFPAICPPLTAAQSGIHSPFYGSGSHREFVRQMCFILYVDMASVWGVTASVLLYRFSVLFPRLASHREAFKRGRCGPDPLSKAKIKHCYCGRKAGI